jgi:DNA-binding transcriptional ArsR family regulator
MKNSFSTLCPLLRSDALGLLMAGVYLAPESEFTLSELAERSGQSVASVMRDVDRLVGAEYLLERRVGRSRLVCANKEHPLYSQFSAIFIHSYGPLSVIPKLLEAVSGLEGAFIFGSWASRYSGTAGPSPQDVDVLLIGEPTLKAVFKFSSLASDALLREVNPVVVSAEDWEKKSSSFLKTLAKSPLVKALDRG